MLVFLVFLGVMAVLLFALPDKDYSPNEKRYLASAPEAVSYTHLTLPTIA